MGRWCGQFGDEKLSAAALAKLCQDIEEISKSLFGAQSMHFIPVANFPNFMCGD
jgi:hypothetical protein